MFRWWRAQFRAQQRRQQAVRTTLLVITTSVIGAEVDEIVHLFRAPCTVQLEICQGEHTAQVDDAGSGRFVTVSLPATG